MFFIVSFETKNHLNCSQVAFLELNNVKVANKSVTSLSKTTLAL